MTRKYYFDDIVRRLEMYLHADVGYPGFKVLLYGWRIKHKLPVWQFVGRDYLNEWEVHSFSRYAGYDLSEDPKIEK